MARPRQSEGTRERLLDEGLEAFVAQGFHGTGIQEVLGRVGVPKGSFYHYFESKEAFGAAVIAHYADGIARKLADARAHAPDPVTGLRRFFEGLIVEFEASRFTGGCLVANLSGELEGSEPCREALAAAFRGWRDGVAAALAEGQRQGLVRADADARDLADVLVESWEGAVIRMKIEHSTSPLRKCLARHLGGSLRP